MSKSINIWSYFALCAFFVGGLTQPIEAQSDMDRRISELESRVDNIEDYLKKLEPTLNDFSSDMIQNVDYRLNASSDKVIVLNAVSKTFSKIETNSGSFLIAVNKLEKIDKGFRVHLQIGNPNSVVYKGVNLTLRWGKRWDPSYAKVKYDEWRQSLMEAEYFNNSVFDPGTWVGLAVDLVPADPSQIDYIECEMEMNTIRLKSIGL